MKTGHEFWIGVRFDSKVLRYKVKKTVETEDIELFEVIARNKNLLIQGNRPLIRKHSKTRRIDWKLIEGELHNMHFLEEIISQIDHHVRQDEKFIS